MNVKKQQMQLQLQLQQPQRRHDRTGFEALLDQPMPVAETSPPGGTLPWSTAVTGDTAGRYDHPHRRRGPPVAGAGPSDAPSDHTGSPTEADDATAAVAAARPGRPQDQAVTTPPPSSPLQLPSPYYDRNPVISFPVHHHHRHHHRGSKSPPPPSTNATATVPLANVQNVAYATGDQDHKDHYANSSKYYYQRHNYKSGDSTEGRDDDKENIKQRDTAECLQQQLDEVLQACVDYEERNKSQQQPQSESSGNTSPGTGAPSTTTPPQQNRIKTNGSLPRDSKKSATETSSPTSPLSPMTSPLSPSSTTWSSVTSPSPPTMSPLSLRAVGGDSDSVFLENDNQPPSTAICGSPRTRIRTLVPSCTTAIEELYYNGVKDQIGQSQHNGQDSTDAGFKTSPTTADNLSSKSPDRPMQLQSTFLQSSPPPSWQTTTMWLRSSPFAADPKDGGSTKAPTVSFAAADRLAEAAEQRRKLLVELSAHKSRLVELHLRREEVDRELIIETALLRAELDAADDETRQSDNIVDGLDRAVADCRQKMDVCTVKQQDQRMAADSQLAGHRQTLQGLRKRLESIEDNDVLKTEIRASIDKQTELLDAEQKLYEDVEFGLLEEEAGWLARREELHRDRAAAVAVRRARRARAEWLRAQLDQLRSVGDDQLRALRADINTATLSIQQGHKKLQELDATATSTTAPTNTLSDQYRRPHQFHKEAHSMQSAAEHQPPKSLEWSWDQHMKSPMSPRPPSSLSWDLQPPRSPWFSTTTPVTEDTAANNGNGLMTGSMTTTCCSSIGSSGGEDDGCARPVSDDSISRMSMSTIFDGGATIKLRPKNKTSPSDITKRPLTRYLPIRYDDNGSTENQMAFDLRAHIESAGHQLDDDNSTGVDRHFWIDSTSCRGYLKKLSGSGANNARRSGRKWLKRWFVFDRRSRALSYYRHRSDDGSDAANQRAGAAATEKKIAPRASIRFQVKDHRYIQNRDDCRPYIIETLKFMYDLQLTSNMTDSIAPTLARPRYPFEVLFAIGGWSGGSPTAIIETYDTKSDRWTRIFEEDTHGPRAYHGTIVMGYYIYIIGGFDGLEYFNSCRKFNTVTKIWEEVAPMNCKRCYVSVVLLNGIIYAMGGFDGHHRLGSAEKYNFERNQWTMIAPMTSQRSDACAAVMNGKIYITGGFNGQECMNTAETYNADTNEWTLIPPMQTRRSGVSCITYHNCLYVIGGFNGLVRMNSSEKFDPTTNHWSPVVDMCNPRSNFAVEVLDDMIFVAGGFNGVTTIAQVECYNDRTDEW